MLVLGIESTCDETACSLVIEGKQILSNVISSQIDIHREFGGVVPELACRRHIDVILPIIKEALEEGNRDLADVDLIAAAHGPGLIGALLIGLNAAKSLALAIKKPFIAVNHIEAHLYAALMSLPAMPSFPCLGVVLSGGHTSILKINSLGNYAVIGQTVDDAIGEAFDKAAKILNLPYPGGPRIEEMASLGDPYRYSLKPGNVKGRPFDFSFSGLKTAMLYLARGQNGVGPMALNEKEQCDAAAAFQCAAFNDVIEKTLAAASLHRCQTIIFGGGVTNSQTLRRMFSEKENELNFLWPSKGLSLDNGAMIAGLGYHKFMLQGSDTLSLEAQTRIPF